MLISISLRSLNTAPVFMIMLALAALLVFGSQPLAKSILVKTLYCFLLFACAVAFFLPVFTLRVVLFDLGFRVCLVAQFVEMLWIEIEYPSKGPGVPALTSEEKAHPAHAQKHISLPHTYKLRLLYGIGVLLYFGWFLLGLVFLSSGV